MPLLTGFSEAYAGQSIVMVFIDGAYLRKNLKEIFGQDEISYFNLANTLTKHTQYTGSKILPQLKRIYYYDAILQNINIITRVFELEIV
jgi:hypothetical protein